MFHVAFHYFSISLNVNNYSKHIFMSMYKVSEPVSVSAYYLLYWKLAISDASNNIIKYLQYYILYHITQKQT